MVHHVYSISCRAQKHVICPGQRWGRRGISWACRCRCHQLELELQRTPGGAQLVAEIRVQELEQLAERQAARKSAAPRDEPQ